MVRVIIVFIYQAYPRMEINPISIFYRPLTIKISYASGFYLRPLYIKDPIRMISQSILSENRPLTMSNDKMNAFCISQEFKSVYKCVTIMNRIPPHCCSFQNLSFLSPDNLSCSSGLPLTLRNDGVRREILFGVSLRSFVSCVSFSRSVWREWYSAQTRGTGLVTLC